MPRCAHDGCQRWRPTWLAARAVSFDGEWFCGADCLRAETESRLRAYAPEAVSPPAPRFRLGTLLLAARLITPAVLEQALARQRASHRPLGAELLAMGAVAAPALTQVLAKQAGVPTLIGLTPAHVERTVGGLSRAVVRALGLVPFALDERDGFRVAVTAPVPRTALRALERMTGQRARPYLVPDATHVALLDAYGTTTSAPDGMWLASPIEAAAHIAASAHAGRFDAWRCVPATTFTWVRLEGTTGSDDLIVTHLAKENPWQAAPIPH